MQTRILVADDNAEIREILRILLTGEGYEVIEAKDGNEVLQLFDSSIDLIILDIMMPNMNGYQTCLKLRETSNVPILFLTAKGLDSDKTLGFSSGADDYLAKPFHLEELEARIRSLTRRQFTQNDVVLTCGKISFDTKTRIAAAGGQELSLTRKEIGILEYLLLNQGRPVSQEELLDHVWDNSVDTFSNSIRVHISALRKKLRAALGFDPVRNRIGEGYVMEEEKL